MGKRKRSGSFSKNDDSGAKKSDECEDSQEELDSENVAGLTKGSSATRCSARVQEKQEKLRRESSPSKQLAPLEVTCPPISSANNASSTVKGNAKFPSPSNEDTCIIGDVGTNLPVPVGLEEKRKKRNWEVWSIEDKQLFFEALNEHGKDFDAIQNYLATKLKPRSKSILCSQYAAKNKDQVRHFYYRTWNKISKHLRFPPDMKKANQELYGLINYGELRKKQRVLNPKSAAKLCELVENGITSIKFRGKTCRIKTPVCRALKRLNGLEDVEHTRVPHKLSLEFIPKDGKTWRSIQSVSQNPRTKVFVNLQRTLSSVILFLENKWKRNDDRLKEQFSSVFGKRRARLRVIPVDKRELSIPIFRVAENTSSATICLRSYTQNMLVRERHEESESANAKIKRKRKQSGVGSAPSGNVDPNCNLLPNIPLQKIDAVDYCPADAENSDAESQFVYPFCNFPSDGQFSPHDSDLRPSDEQSNDAAWKRFQQRWLDEEEQENQRLISNCSVDNPSTYVNNATTETDNDEADHCDHDPEDGIEKLCPCGSGKVAESGNFVVHVWDEERSKIGWNAEEAGVMTIGEVYLLLGITDKICFQYFWDTPESDPEDARSHNLLERLLTTARLLKKKKSSRSKTNYLNSPTVVNCGSQISCSKCGQKTEIPGSGSCISKIISSGVSHTNTVINSVQSLLRNRTHTSTITLEQQHPVLPPSISSAPAIIESSNALITSPLVGSSPCTSASSSASLFPQPEYERTTVINMAGFEQPVTLEEFLNSDSMLSDCTLAESLRFESGESQTPMKDLNQSNYDQHNSTVRLNSSQFTITQNNNGGLMELSSLATKSQDSSMAQQMSSSSGLRATLLPGTSPMVKRPNHIIRIMHSNNIAVDNSITEPRRETTNTPKDAKVGNSHMNHTSSSAMDGKSKDKITFHRPTPLRPLEPALPTGEVQDCPPPKPFLDLPKGNRRLGRRPNFKRVIIPRVLPLLPKNQTLVSVVSTAGDGTSNNLQRPIVALVPISNQSVIPSETATGKSAVGKVPKSAVANDKSEVNSSKSDVAKPVFKLGEASQPSTSSSSKPSESRLYNEIFLGAPSNSACNSNDFEDLLKLRRQESISNSGDMDFSLSSFMEISLPESAKMAANDCINIDDLDNSNCSINLSNLLSSLGKPPSKELAAAESDPAPRKPLPIAGSSTTDVHGLSVLANFENPWTLEPGEMSLSNIFGHFDSTRGSSGIPEGDVNFPAMLEDGSLDFTSKLTELTSPLSESRK